MADSALTRILTHRKYLELRTRRNRLGWSLAALMMVVYFGNIAMIASGKDFLARPIGDGVTTIGIPLVVGVIIFTIVITGIHVRRANGEFDRLTPRSWTTRPGEPSCRAGPERRDSVTNDTACEIGCRGPQVQRACRLAAGVEACGDVAMHEDE